jgi:transglutaminase-like putative cysteine protease
LIYAVRHRSSYAYQETVDLSDHLLHLTPRRLPWQRVIETSLRTEPATPSVAHDVDYFGNAVSFLSLPRPHDHLVIEMSARVEVTARPAFDPAASPPWESVRDALDGGGFPADVAATEFAGDSPLAPAGREFAAYAAPSFPPGRPLLEAVLDLTRRIHREFTFDPHATELATPLTEIIETQRGVCQDFAHAEIAALRSLGLAARYVSGYIRTYPAPGRPRLVGADASHAWASVYCPGLGWIDVDPTNDLVVGEEHITLAWGRDYGDVSPVRGVILGSGEHSLAVSVDVAAEG